MMAERSKDQHALNEVAHTSRREVIRVLGGTALLGPFVLSGCFSRDPLSPDDDSGLQLRLNAQASEECPLPLILFVPGYTGAPEWLSDPKDLKTKYYETQKAMFNGDDPNNVPEGGKREWMDMKKEPGFDSNRSAVQCNADAIAAVLQQCKNKGRKITIISHSKGGQDVLHALVELKNEAKLPYRDEDLVGEAPGDPINEDLWSTVAGWVAFTSNFFEATFPIAGDDSGCDTGFNGLPAICSIANARLGGCGTPPPSCSPRAGSLYSNFPRSGAAKLKFLKGVTKQKKLRRQRVDYMHDHQDAIRSLMGSVPTMSLYATYVPENNVDGSILFGTWNGSLNRTNLGIRREAQNADNPKPGGASDGLVPARAGQLPGADIRKLSGDAASLRCGADHLAPALVAKDKEDQFWTNDFRNQKTLQFVQEVEALSSGCPVEVPDAIEVEIDIKPGSGPNSINCNNPNGVIPVAILSSDSFDATTVDHTTVTFEGASETHMDKRTGQPRRHEEDVNGDGRMDLVFHFRLGDADLGCSSTEARLEGETFDGQPIFGVDSIRMVEGGNP